MRRMQNIVRLGFVVGAVRQGWGHLKALPDGRIGFYFYMKLGCVGLIELWPRSEPRQYRYSSGLTWLIIDAMYSPEPW